MNTTQTIEVSKIQNAIKLAWNEARHHGNPFISLESVLLMLGMSDAAYTNDTGHRALDFSRLGDE